MRISLKGEIIMSSTQNDSHIIPSGTLLLLKVNDIKPNPNNPRRLFDPGPLSELKESIKVHGVLVPITAYKLPGQEKYAIVDGERRYRCCVELSKEGLFIEIPTNIVQAPNSTASLIYMFNIHAFREQWELMPTALSLQEIKKGLNINDRNELHQITGLSISQIERCEKILSFPKEFQDLSLDSDPAKRIPSNFWVELFPVLEQIQNLLPDIQSSLGRDGITWRLVNKYQNKKIRSVVHFRRVLEAIDFANNDEQLQNISDVLRSWILDPELETRQAFDKYSQETKQIKKSVFICDKFISDISKTKVEYMVDGKNEIINKLEEVITISQNLLEKLKGLEPPNNNNPD